MWYSSIASVKKSPSRQESNKKAKQSFDDTDAMEKESSCQENLRQYLLNSTLHGLRYVGERQISTFERFLFSIDEENGNITVTLYFRVFFVLSFLFVLMLSIFFISNIYEKWTASPIIIAQNAYATSISEFPFPAVTICNLNQVKKSKIENVHKGSIESMLLKSLCQLSNDDEEMENYQGKWSSFRDFLLNVSVVCLIKMYYIYSLCTGIAALFRDACCM